MSATVHKIRPVKQRELDIHDARKRALEDDEAAFAELEARDWQPQELPEKAPAVEFLPYSQLPEVLARWVVVQAAAIGCAPDGVAVSLVCTLASLLAGRVQVQPMPHNRGWQAQFSLLWGAIVDEPSRAKSAAKKTAERFLKRLAAQEKRRWREVMRQWQAEAAARKKAGEVVDDAEAPVCRQYRTTKPTSEGLAKAAAHARGGFLLSRDELVGLLADENLEETLLSGWNGDDDVIEARKVAAAQDVPIVAFNTLGTIQPDKLAPYAKPRRGDSGGSGMLQRFSLLVYPDKRQGLPENNPPEVDADGQPIPGTGTNARLAAADEAVWPIFQALASITPEVDADGMPRLYTLIFGEGLRGAIGASEEFICWLEGVRLSVRDLPQVLISHGDKYPGAVAALAGLFHLVECVSAGETLAEALAQRVPVRCVKMALAWIPYLEHHAQRAYGVLCEDARDVDAREGARIILARLRKGQVELEGEGFFTARAIVRRGWRGLGNLAKVAAALDVLETADQVRSYERAPGAKGGRPSVRYLVQPELRPE